MPRDHPPSSFSPTTFTRDANWLTLAGPLVIFTGLMLSGEMQPAAVLGLTFLGGVLALAAIADARARRDLARVRGLLWPAILVAAVLAVGALSLTPFLPGGPHPVWLFTQAGPPAATMDKARTAFELIKLCGLACFFVVGAATAGQDRRAELALNVTLLLGVAMALWSFFQVVTGVYGTHGTRLQGPFLNPNAEATISGMLLVLAIAFIARRLRSGDAVSATTTVLPLACAALIFAVCLAMSVSRGGAFATVVGFGVFGLLQFFGGGGKSERLVWVAAIGFLVLVLVIGMTGPQLFERLFTTDLKSEDRGELLQAHWDAFKASPWSGAGLGAFDPLNSTLINDQNVASLWFIRSTHNVYLQWLTLGGLLAAVPMFGCIAVVILLSLRNTFRRMRMKTVLFGLFGLNAVILAHGFTDFALEYYTMAAFWAYLLGLQFNLAQGSSRR